MRLGHPVDRQRGSVVPSEHLHRYFTSSADKSRSQFFCHPISVQTKKHLISGRADKTLKNYHETSKGKLEMWPLFLRNKSSKKMVVFVLLIGAENQYP
jgi:hypothetical protein